MSRFTTVTYTAADGTKHEYEIPDAWLMGRVGTMGDTYPQAIRTWHVQAQLAEGTA